MAEVSVPLQTPLFRGERRLRIALVGLPGAGKTTLFEAVSSTAPQRGELTGTHHSYRECTVQIGFDEAGVVDLPSLHSLHHLAGDDLSTLKYLLWGDRRPPVSLHEKAGPPAPFAAPDLIVQVVDASNLQSHLELTLELSQLGRPIVLALNHMDEALAKGLYINIRALARVLGVPVVPTVALMGQGLTELFKAAVDAARTATCALPQPPSRHIAASLAPLDAAMNLPELHAAFRLPHPLLLVLFAAADGFIEDELQQHFPHLLPQFRYLRAAAGVRLPRPLAEELHADRHHRAA